MKFISKISLLLVCLFFIGFASLAQNNEPCGVNPFEVKPQGTKYIGGCLNGQAEGLGILTENSGNTIKGIFKNNVLQDGIVEYTFFQKNDIYVGPYVNGKLNGWFTYYNLEEMYVRTRNMIPEYNEFIDDWNYFNIPEPKMISNNIFPLYQEFKDPKYPIYEVIDGFEKPIEIPNSSLKIFSYRKRKTQKGNDGFTGFALYDARTNMVVRIYGNPGNSLGNFLSFSPDFKSFYATNLYAQVKKVVKIEIASGIISAIPTELEKSYFEKQKLYVSNQENGFAPLPISTSKYIFKSKNVWAGSFYNSEFTVNTLEGVLLQKLILNQKSINIFAINENLQQVVISEISNDSTFINLYSLESLKLIKKIHAFKGGGLNKIGFSSSGKYLYISTSSKGTLIFKECNPYFGVVGNLLDFNNEENIVLTFERSSGVLDGLKDTYNRGVLVGYDLLNRKVLWKTQIKEGSPISYGGFKIDNDILILTNNVAGVGKEKPHIIRFNLDYPSNSPTFFTVNFGNQEQVKLIRTEINNKIEAEKAKKEAYANNQPRSALIEGNGSAANSTENSDNLNCNYKFIIPTTVWKFIDNRKVCISCKKVYVSYTKNNLVDAKKNATAAIIRANLENHLKKINASDEHKKSDEKRLNQFLVKNNFGMMGVISSMFQASMGEMKEFFYGDKKALLNEIDLYEVENSRFCSPKCEYFYNNR